MACAPTNLKLLIPPFATCDTNPPNAVTVALDPKLAIAEYEYQEDDEEEEEEDEENDVDEPDDDELDEDETEAGVVAALAL